jgi:dual specificity phosphatase 12
LSVAKSTRYRTEHKISHIVSVCTDPVPADWPESGQKQLRIPIQDLDHEDLLVWMPKACRFIDESLREGGTVLIHSERGQSRSAAIAAAYCTSPTNPSPTPYSSPAVPSEPLVVLLLRSDVS